MELNVFPLGLKNADFGTGTTVVDRIKQSQDIGMIIHNHIFEEEKAHIGTGADISGVKHLNLFGQFVSIIEDMLQFCRIGILGPSAESLSNRAAQADDPQGIFRRIAIGISCPMKRIIKDLLAQVGGGKRVRSPEQIEAGFVQVVLLVGGINLYKAQKTFHQKQEDSHDDEAEDNAAPEG